MTTAAMRQTFAVALLLALPAAAAAQRMGGVHFAGGTAFHGGRFAHRGYPGSYYASGFFDPFYTDYASGPEYGTDQPQIVVLQNRKPTPAPEPIPAPSQPLMIELQGDRYVQISGDRTIDSSAPTRLISRPDVPAPQPAPIPTAVLVFRDGHRQQVSAYTIADGTLYANSDYATTGTWTQKIALSALNVSETVAANSTTGHPFQLPHFPNEVIVGP